MDTKLQAPVAGSVSGVNRSRRAAIGLGAAWALMTVAACTPSPTRRSTISAATGGLLSPVRSISGARLLLQTNQSGMPTTRQPGSFGGMTPLVFPVAVAVSMLDVFIADAGAGRLYRYDPTLDAMAIIAGATVNPQTRLAAGPDGSVLVTTPGAGMPLRFDRAGNPLQRVNAQTGSDHYDDVVIDPETGRFLALDRIQRRLDEVSPVGHRGIVLADRQLPDAPVAIAMDRRKLYVSGRHCSCVVAIDPLTGRQATVIEDLKDVGALAAGGGWLVVADSVQRHLFVHRDGMLRGEPSFEALKLANPQGMAIFNDSLYVADGSGRRIAVFRLSP